MSAGKDVDDLFARIRDGSASDDDHEKFYAVMIERFIDRSFAGEAVEPWIARALATAFRKVLDGGDWTDEFPLPGRRESTPRPWRKQRDLEIYTEVANDERTRTGVGVTHAIRDAATKFAVSYETARAAYYDWLHTVEAGKVSKNTPQK